MAVPLEGAAEPGRQSRHLPGSELPGTGLALPEGHSMQLELLDAPRNGLYEPAGHCSKVIEALAAPTLAQYPPTGQRSHADWPVDAANVPIGHAVHADALAAPLNEPSAQSKQRTDPLKLVYVPAAQDWQAVPSPPVCAMPRGHLEQVCEQGSRAAARGSVSGRERQPHRGRVPCGTSCVCVASAQRGMSRMSAASINVA